ncbi:putative amino acid/polyamine transporter I, cationic amino acid transporter [Lupinus albus]|uniref:Putative amino acid/polyamine transporter I, cationic amino acid transporter n=1 Tax=Lupinus albus TaxID=3870 RepID=A0A6A4NJG1_LUPAL|nr:putative amino acid/polyamine transporter I, cationic amino acid transporter [Lupinus albus]
MNTPHRFMDRVVARSTDHMELVDMKARSNNEMKKTLNWWDLIWFGVGAVIGAGIFVLTGLETREVAGPAVVLSYVVSGISALLSVLCYTEFAVEIPVAGGSFAYLRVELGDFVAFITAENILLEYVISGAAVARSWTSYFATLCNKNPDNFRIVVHGKDPNYGHLDPIAIAVLTVITTLTIFSIKGSSVFNYIASMIHIFAIIFIIIVGLINANPKNYTPFAPFGVRGVFQASAVLIFAYVGFDAVSTMAEETKNPARDIPIGLIGSMVMNTLAYCLLAVTLCLMQPYNTIDVDAPFSVTFRNDNCVVGECSGQARYLTHIARIHMMSPWFAHVNEKTGTPVNATISMLVATFVIALFTNLGILSNLLSISTLFIFMLVAVGLLVRRYYSSGEGIKLSSLCSLCILLDPHVEYLFTLQVVMVPSLSIAINIFLLGSIDKDSFIRFAIWTGFLLVYYILFGLHASYDTTKEFETKASSDDVEHHSNNSS